MKKIKISELPICTTLKGLFTIGTDNQNRSVKVSLQFVEDKTNEAILKAEKATEAANTATEEVKAALGALLPYHEDQCSYGIQYDLNVGTPSCIRIGNMALHKTLPIQSRMKGCLLDDCGKVVEYLDPRDWTRQVRDGSRGQVMVEIPLHYRKFKTDGTKHVVSLSELPLPGYQVVPKMYVSAYEASLEHSTGKLCSVVNMDTDYRGGTNNASYDGTYRTLLGRPVTSISRTGFRTAARKRGSSSWNCYLYDVHKTIFWLFCVEYATLNSQDAYTAELTHEGYRQGGLGLGVTNWDSLTWYKFNGYNPFVPCGYTDSIGNQTGVVAYTANGDTGLELMTSNVIRYRGIENPFGHIMKWSDGINVRISANTENGGDGLSKVFVCSDASKFSDANSDEYKYVGNEARNPGFVKEIIFGEEGDIIPSLVGGGSSQYFCDHHYTNTPTSGEQLRVFLFSGHAYHGSNAGLAYASSSGVPSESAPHIGTRLCYIPVNA